MTEMNLSMEMKEFVVSLLKLRVSEETVALMLMLLPEEEQKRKLARYLTTFEEEVVEKYETNPNIVNEIVLDYLMNNIKGTGIGVPTED